MSDFQRDVMSGAKAVADTLPGVASGIGTMTSGIYDFYANPKEVNVFGNALLILALMNIPILGWFIGISYIIAFVVTWSNSTGAKGAMIALLAALLISPATFAWLIFLSEDAAAFLFGPVTFSCIVMFIFFKMSKKVFLNENCYEIGLSKLRNDHGLNTDFRSGIMGMGGNASIIVFDRENGKYGCVNKNLVISGDISEITEKTWDEAMGLQLIAMELDRDDVPRVFFTANDAKHELGRIRRHMNPKDAG